MQIDVLEPVVSPARMCKCGERMERTWLAKPPSVISDECDIEVRHGLCNPDGSPRRFTSKSEMHREAARRGLSNHVVHQGTAGGDKSPHTTRWT